MTVNFWDYWYYFLPDYVLAALLYSMLGRFVLSFFVPPDWDNYIWRGFCKITDPVFKSVRWLTPAAAPLAIVFLLSFIWIIMLRVALVWALTEAGLMPVAGRG